MCAGHWGWIPLEDGTSVTYNSPLEKTSKTLSSIILQDKMSSVGEELLSTHIVSVSLLFSSQGVQWSSQDSRRYFHPSFSLHTLYSGWRDTHQVPSPSKTVTNTRHTPTSSGKVISPLCHHVSINWKVFYTLSYILYDG